MILGVIGAHIRGHWGQGDLAQVLILLLSGKLGLPFTCQSFPPHLSPSVCRLPGRPFAGQFSASSAFSAVNVVSLLLSS